MPTTPSTVVPLLERSDISCLPDRLSIFLPASLVSEGHNVTWREETCAVTFNGTHYVSSVELSECGTTVRIENDTVIFSNELVVHKLITNGTVSEDGDDVEEDITYGSEFETVIPVQCIYPRHNNLSTSYTPVKQNVRFFEKRYGELHVAMEQFDSEEYVEPLAQDGSPRKVPLDEDIYIRIGLSSDPAGLKVKADQCIATSSRSPADKNWHRLIQER